MAESKIIVRMSKSTGFIIKVIRNNLNNKSKAELNYVNNRQVFIAESGKILFRLK
jgi:hypothetical protein